MELGAGTSDGGAALSYRQAGKASMGTLMRGAFMPEPEKMPCASHPPCAGASSTNRC